MEQQVVAFRLAGELYGVDIVAVEGIIRLQPLTVVPQAPESVLGMINLRGSVLPVVDLRRRLGLGQLKESPETRIIVIDAGAGQAGMVVDAVTEVVRLPSEAIEPPLPIMNGSEGGAVKGIARLGEQLLILLDLGSVIREPSDRAQAAVRAA